MTSCGCSARRRFIREELAPHQTRWRQQHHPDPEAWTKADSTGILLTDVPEKYGGGGGTFAHEAVVTEELAQAGVHFGFSILNRTFILSSTSD
jgi:acyl-CoA dehydrogenase